MLRLLYVEDDANSRAVLQMAIRLCRGEYALTLFADSLDFEARLLNTDPPPDLILLDIHVQPLTGFDMLEIIRAYPQYDHVPVVALTASVMNEEIRTLQAAGFHGVISKPLNLDDFPELMRRILDGEHIWYVW